jgi:hypothetical protein
VLHICLRVPGDPQNALAKALQSLTVCGGAYAEVDWMASGVRLIDRIIDTASHVKPTLIFAQIQTAGILSGGEMDRIRRVCAPGCVIVQWDGDHRHDHTDGQDREWFRNLSQGCDINAVTCTRDVEEYAEQGVRGAAYLQIGVDTDLWRPTTPDIHAPDVVMLANCNARLGYETRRSVARMLSQSYPDGFAVYGHGWEQEPGVRWLSFVPHQCEAPIYSRSVAALSISIRNDLPRYTSDRLLRCLASGALTLVEAFPDMEGLGLRDGYNCMTWCGEGELHYLVGKILENHSDRYYSDIRCRARELALTHSWDARMGELMAMVQSIRETRA